LGEKIRNGLLEVVEMGKMMPHKVLLQMFLQKHMSKGPTSVAEFGLQWKRATYWNSWLCGLDMSSKRFYGHALCKQI
jgi:hypothetical protein